MSGPGGEGEEDVWAGRGGYLETLGVERTSDGRGRSHHITYCCPPSHHITYCCPPSLIVAHLPLLLPTFPYMYSCYCGPLSLCCLRAVYSG